MGKYRTHNCNELSKKEIGKNITLSGWINKKRDHGNLLFIDLRDNYGITQCVIDKDNSNFKALIYFNSRFQDSYRYKTWKISSNFEDEMYK